MVVVDEGQEDGCVNAAVLFVLGFVFLDWADFQVLVGVAHFSKVPRYDRPREFLLGFPIDILRKLHCGVKGLFLECLFYGPLYVDGLAVLSLFLERGDQRTALHYLSRSEFSVLVEDGGVSQPKLVSNFLEVVPWVLALLLLLGVICEDFIHEGQFFTSDCGSNLPVFLAFAASVGKDSINLHGFLSDGARSDQAEL